MLLLLFMFLQPIKHTAVVVEWASPKGRSMSILELAWMGGLGGYRGRSNWITGKESSTLYHAMPSSMKTPWRTDMSEIRMIDLTAKNIHEFEVTQFVFVFSLVSIHGW